MTKGPLNRFLFRILIFILPLVAGFEILFRMGIYPVITNSVLFDYKMTLLQKKHLRDVRLMAVGSSSGLHALSSSVMVRNFGSSFYNFSSWGMQVSDLRSLIVDMVSQYRPEFVIFCSCPADFRKPPNDTYENYTSMPPFIRNNLPEMFYFKPFASVHRLFYRKWEQPQPHIDEWGGNPETHSKESIHQERWNINFLFPTQATPDAYNALDTLSTWLHDRNIPLIFVEIPVNLGSHKTRENRRLLEQHIEKCQSIVTLRGGIFLNYCDPAVFSDSLFFDQTHLQAAGADLLTTKLAAQLKKIIK
jgi:hypothetical protein